jgi:tRNA A-37 threonylcarbamoyl transferase component Bud32
MTSDDEVDRFLAEACSRGYLAADAAAECRRIAALFAEMGTAMPIDEIAVKKGFLRQQQSDTVRRALAPKRIGRYEVLNRLGSGGAGIVWRARDTESGSIVALKYLARAVADDERVRERFLREARVAMTLRHPNIVRGLDSGEDVGAAYLAMEFVPGESLAERISREGRVPEREAFRIAREVARALEYVQQFKLVHRDVKPANLLLTPEGDVKLCDLGLTRVSLHEAEDLGIQETALGTAAYVSPEQIERPDTIDWRADVYSLGATLYHALAGAPPFAGDSPKEIARKHAETPARDPREHALDLSEGATTVVLKMLHKEPTKRYATLGQLAEDLEAVRDGRTPLHTLSVAPIVEKPAAAERRHRAPQRRTRSGGVLLAVAVLAAAGGLAWLRFGPGAKDVPPGGAGATGATPPSAAKAPPTDTAATAEGPPRIDPRSTAAASAALREALDYQRAHPEEFDESRKRLDDVVRRFSDAADGAG